MNDKRHALRLVAALACVLGAAALPAGACAIPVCRFALERWLPEDYEIVVFHRGSLAQDAKGAVKLLQARSEAERLRANVYVTTVDLAGQPDDEAKALWKAQKDPTLPWAVLRYPERFRPDAAQSLWAGPLTTAAAKALVGSPARQEIAKRIIGGDAAVWVLLESGDKKTDDAAAAVLTKELAVAQREFQPPPPAPLEQLPPQPGDEELPFPPAPKPMKIKFSMLRLSRTDAGETPLISMLMHSEPELATKYASQTMAFPIFGRGRSLYGFVGKGINTDNVLEACAFLVGPCSCQVKELNPGTDLLMTADWDAVFDEELAPEQPVVPPAGLAAPGVGTGTVAAAIDLTPEAAPVAAGSARRLLRNIAVAVGLVLVVALVVAGLMLRKGGGDAVRS
jgi:hypothetical protein